MTDITERVAANHIKKVASSLTVKQFTQTQVIVNCAPALRKSVESILEQYKFQWKDAQGTIFIEDAKAEKVMEVLSDLTPILRSPSEGI